MAVVENLYITGLRVDAHGAEYILLSRVSADRFLAVRADGHCPEPVVMIELDHHTLMDLAKQKERFVNGNPLPDQ